MKQPSIDIRNGERIKLSTDALKTLIGDHFYLQRNIVVSFDRRIADSGRHDVINDMHYIRIGTKNIEHWDAVCQMHEIINTLLHELYHAMQWEEYGNKVYENELQEVRKVTKSSALYQYCPLELAARSYADHNHHDAITKYEKLTSEISRTYRTGSFTGRVRSSSHKPFRP